MRRIPKWLGTAFGRLEARNLEPLVRAALAAPEHPAREAAAIELCQGARRPARRLT